MVKEGKNSQSPDVNSRIMADIQYKKKQLIISLLFFTLHLNHGVCETQDRVWIPRLFLGYWFPNAHVIELPTTGEKMQTIWFLQEWRVLFCSWSYMLVVWGRDAQGQNKPDHWVLLKFDLIFANIANTVCILICFWSRLTVPLVSFFYFFFWGGGGVIIIIIATIAIIITSLQWFFSHLCSALLRPMKRNQTAFVSCGRRVQIDWLKTLFLFLI